MSRFFQYYLNIKLTVANSAYSGWKCPMWYNTHQWKTNLGYFLSCTGINEIEFWKVLHAAYVWALGRKHTLESDVHKDRSASKKGVIFFFFFSATIFAASSYLLIILLPCRKSRRIYKKLLELISEFSKVTKHKSNTK